MCDLCLYHHDHGDFNSDPMANSSLEALYTSLNIDEATLKQKAATTLGTGSSWDGSNARNSTTEVTFGFNIGKWGAPGGTGNQGGLISNVTEPNKELTRDYLEKLSNFADINFTESTDSDTDVIIRSEDMSRSSVGGYAYFPGSGIGGNVTYDTEFDNGPNGAATGFGTFAMVHELGHAMGLPHTFNGSPSTPIAGGLEGEFMTAGWSVMGYRDGGGFSRSDVTGWQILDVYMLQQKYGKDMTHNATDTVYEFAPQKQKFGEAIWDAGGNDRIEITAQSTVGGTIDLREGELNKIGDSVKFRIAFEAEIENATGAGGADNIRGNGLDNDLRGGLNSDTIHGDAGDDIIYGGAEFDDPTDSGDLLLGGDGNDIILGNGGDDTILGGDGYTDANDGDDVLFGGLGNDQIYGNGGDDILVGGAGIDSLYGGVGDDIYVIGNGNGLDIIYGFEGAGGSGGDKIRVLVDVNGTGLSTLDAILANAVDDGTNTEFKFGDHSVIVADHTVGDFTIDDFELARTTDDLIG